MRKAKIFGKARELSRKIRMERAMHNTVILDEAHLLFARPGDKYITMICGPSGSAKSAIQQQT